LPTYCSKHSHRFTQLPSNISLPTKDYVQICHSEAGRGRPEAARQDEGAAGRAERHVGAPAVVGEGIGQSAVGEGGAGEEDQLAARIDQDVVGRGHIFNFFLPVFYKNEGRLSRKPMLHTHCHFFGKNVGHFLENQCYDHFFRIGDYNMVKKSAIFWRKYFKNRNIASRLNGSAERSA
jgi:hypothetical protein